MPKSFIESAKPPIKTYLDVIKIIKSELLGERKIIQKANIKQTQFRVIKADLMQQGIIREVNSGGKKYEYIFNAPVLDTKMIEDLKDIKSAELQNMIGYVETTGSRMKYLCDYLGDTGEHDHTNCDNTSLPKFEAGLTADWSAQITEFRENYFPDLDTQIGNMVNGVAASYYGVSTVGKTIHRCKYERGGDYPDHLLKLTLKAFRKRYGQEKFDLVLYVPPTTSGDLVKNFAEKIARVLGFPISHDLLKTRSTDEQKKFNNSYAKKDNVNGAFILKDETALLGKKILVIDDICDSGHTLKEIGNLFTNLGAVQIAPLVIAQTVGGDI